MSFPLLLTVLGLIVGSFLNVVIYRLPRGLSIVRPRSSCPRCGEPIRWYENIPLLSFIGLGGKCRHCRKEISWRYPLVEFLSGALALLLWWKFREPIPALLYFLFLAAPLLAILFIDLEHQIIPNEITLPGILVGLLIPVAIGGNGYLLWGSMTGLLAGGGSLFLISWVYEKTRNREGIGMGDVKLAAMLGAFLGWKGIFVVLFMSSLLGSLVGLALIFFFKKGLRDAIPFGPFLSTAGLLQLLLGEELISFYLTITKYNY